MATVTLETAPPTASGAGVVEGVSAFPQRRLQEERESVWKDNLELVQRDCQTKVGGRERTVC